MFAFNQRFEDSAEFQQRSLGICSAGLQMTVVCFHHGTAFSSGRCISSLISSLWDSPEQSFTLGFMSYQRYNYLTLVSVIFQCHSVISASAMRNLAGPDWVFDMDHWRKISCLGHIAKPEVPLVCTSNLSSDAGILLHGAGWEVCFMGNTHC